MNRVLLCGWFGNGRDYVTWSMETSPEHVDAAVARYQLELGIIRRVERRGESVTYYYLLAEWEHA